MSAIHSLTLSIKAFELHPDQQDHDQVSCQVFLNDQKLSVLDITDLEDSYTFSNINVSDLIQLILTKHAEQEQTASVSFLAEDLLKRDQEKFSRWIGLSENLDNDLYEGDFDTDQEEFPRALISIDVITDFENEPELNTEEEAAQSQLVTNEKEEPREGLGEDNEVDKESDMANFRLSTEYGLANENGEEKIDLDQEIQESMKSQDKVLISSESRDSINSRESGDLNKSFILNKEEKILISHGPAPPAANARDKEEERNVNKSSEALTAFNNPMLGFKKDFGKELERLNEKFRQTSQLAVDARGLKDVLRRREQANGNLEQNNSMDLAAKEYREEISSLKARNDQLNGRIENLKYKVEKLQRENDMIRESEIAYADDLNKTQISLEKVRLRADTNERYAKELEQRLRNAQEQIEREIQFKLEAMRQKERASDEVYEIEQRFEDMKRKYEEEIKESLLRRQSIHITHEDKNDLSLKDEREKDMLDIDDENKALLIENNELKSRIFELESQAEEYRSTVLGFRENLEALKREHNEEMIRNQKKMQETEQLAAMSIILQEMKEKLEEQARTKAEEKEILSNRQSVNNDELDSQNLLIASLNSQIDDMKAHIVILEAEKSSLKEELYKSNDNYSKLTMKYIELTEAMSTAKKDSRGRSASGSHAPSTEADGTPSMRNISHYEEDRDEVETKLHEFTNSNNISSACFNRIDKNNYIFNGKKILMKVVNGKLLVRADLGAGFKGIEEFWKAHKGKAQMRGPPMSSRVQESGGKSDRGVKHDTPERKLHHSFVLNTIENEKAEDSVNISGLDKQSLIEIDKSFTSDSHKNVKEAKGKNENVWVKEAPVMKVREKKPTSSISKLKGKGMKELGPVLGESHKQF